MGNSALPAEKSNYQDKRLTALESKLNANRGKLIIDSFGTGWLLEMFTSNIEPGQCTMIVEEAEKIDQVYRECGHLLKTGYTTRW